jgi:murein tripeptide amidase MpaA
MGRRKVSLLAAFVLQLVHSAALSQPLTVAEASGFKRTSRLADLEAFVGELQRLSPRILVEQIAKSTEGRPVWMLILGDPPPASPREARLTGKPVVFVEANIHAGEVEGKEALQMLARDILCGDKAHLLQNQILLFVPLLNPDGNERISPRNRRDQAGPEGGVGERNNGQDLDLNRDFTKVESPEIQGVLRALNEWDPVLFVDIHTTDGSRHRHVVTYDIPRNPDIDPSITDYLRSRLMQQVEQAMEQRYRSPVIPYGNFRVPGQPDSGWVTYDPFPRYGTNYVGLRNRFSILVENYAYAPFEERVWGCYRFVASILEYTSSHGEEMLRLVREADRHAAARGPGREIALRFKETPCPEPIRILSYRFAPDTSGDRGVRWRETDQPAEYRVPYFGCVIPTARVRLPRWYAFGPAFPEAAETLCRHGITVLRTLDSLRSPVEVFRLETLETGKLPYQGHWLLSVTGHYDTAQAVLPPNSYLVPTSQPLALLIAWLLEPESPDGLLVWNFFDRALRPSEWSARLGNCPVVKGHSEIHVRTTLHCTDSAN